MSAPSYGDFPALDAEKRRILKEEEKARAYTELFYKDAAEVLLSSARSADREEILPVFRDFLTHTAPLSCLHLAALAFAKRLHDRFGALPPPEEFLPFPASPQEICYVKNPYIQRVIDLSGMHAQWFYAEDFDSACSLASEGKRDACILPYLDAEERPMPGIERLINDYGLKKQRLYRFDLDGRSGGCLLLSAALRLPPERAILEWQLFPESDLLLREATELLRAEQISFALPAPIKQSDDLRDAPLSCTLRMEINGALPEIPLYALSLLVPDMSVTGCYDVLHLTDDGAESDG